MMKTIILNSLLVAYVLVGSNAAQESKVVRITQGPVKGYKHDEIFEFYGIPYATAPTGKDKFKAPLPGPTWTETLEAVNDKIICPQVKTPIIDFDKIGLTIKEDCLIANVLMPDTEETNLPVLVNVHGGGYQLGWGHLGTQKSLVKSKKIVAVNFNYRLGIHGFLCLGTDTAPGNAGMKDQVALLRWVKKNIAHFGGNPDDVTIAGGSAGSSAVDLLMLSKSTAGLFNKVIPESGANVGVWSIQMDPLEIAKDFARSKNLVELDNINILEQFYESLSYDDLSSFDFLNGKDSTFGFVPCVERNIGVETFLEDAPVNILERGDYIKVPVLYGFANMEGNMRLAVFDNWSKSMNEQFSDFMPGDLHFKSEDERTKIAKVIKEFYFGDKAVGPETVQEYLDYFSDVMFAYPHLRSTRLQVEAGSDSIYLYIYSFYLVPLLEDAPEFIRAIRGAPHCAQSVAVHDMHPNLTFTPSELEITEEYLKLQNSLREIWLNFITTGKPIPEGSKLPAWPPTDANRSPHMEFGEEIKLRGPLLERRARFWDDIYERYYRTPVPPPQSVLRNEL